jgi:hypothetical protein
MKRLLIALLLLSSFAAAAPRPNIIVILADDMGFSDLGCYGGEIQTPNLDKLAAEGMRFSQFYNCALCGPVACGADDGPASASGRHDAVDRAAHEQLRDDV